MIMQQTLLHPSFSVSFQPLKLNLTTPSRNNNRNWRKPLILCYCFDAASRRTNSTPEISPTNDSGPPVIKKRKRYRKDYLGESKGITEEMRFVAIKLRNLKDNTSDGETWKPSMEGFVKYLVDSQLVFNTVERIVNKFEDVACLIPESELVTAEEIAYDGEDLEPSTGNFHSGTFKDSIENLTC